MAYEKFIPYRQFDPSAIFELVSPYLSRMPLFKRVTTPEIVYFNDRMQIKEQLYFLFYQYDYFNSHTFLPEFLTKVSDVGS